MPSVPMEMPSLMVMVPNMKGTLFASHKPCLTFCAMRSRCTLQGVTSLARFAMATNGLLKSSSCKPTARSIERAGALSGPSTTTWLLCRSIETVSIAITNSSPSRFLCNPL